MQSQTTLKRHAALVDRMATAQGIDLEESLFRGAFSIPDLDDAVLRCTGCTNPRACKQFLDSVDDVVATGPDYCRNAELFAELKRA